MGDEKSFFNHLSTNLKTVKMMLFMLLTCVTVANGADFFIFNGIGDFLCEHYGSEVCADPDAVSVAESSAADSCDANLCASCTGKNLEDDISVVATGNPNPPTGQISGVASGSFGDSSSSYGFCDGQAGWTVAFKNAFTYDGQLDEIAWYVDSKCDYGMAEGLTFAILRPSDLVPGSPCSFKVVNTLELEQPVVDQLLNNAQQGVANFTLPGHLRHAMEFKAGDRLGMYWKGTGLVSFRTGTPGNDNICIDKINPWARGDSFNLTTIAARQSRDFALETSMSFF